MLEALKVRLAACERFTPIAFAIAVGATELLLGNGVENALCAAVTGGAVFWLLQKCGVRPLTKRIRSLQHRE